MPFVPKSTALNSSGLLKAGYRATTDSRGGTRYYTDKTSEGAYVSDVVKSKKRPKKKDPNPAFTARKTANRKKAAANNPWIKKLRSCATDYKNDMMVAGMK